MQTTEPKSEQPSAEDTSQSRRAALRRLSRFAAVTPPAVALILAAGSRPNKAIAASVLPSSRQFKEPVSGAQLQ